MAKTKRIKFGEEDFNWDDGSGICGDCGVKLGQYHKPGCDVELCEICGGQRISCECDNNDKFWSRWTKEQFEKYYTEHGGWWNNRMLTDYGNSIITFFSKTI